MPRYNRKTNKHLFSLKVTLQLIEHSPSNYFGPFYSKRIKLRACRGLLGNKYTNWFLPERSLSCLFIYVFLVCFQKPPKRSKQTACGYLGLLRTQSLTYNPQHQTHLEILNKSYLVEDQTGCQSKLPAAPSPFHRQM